MSGSLFCIGDLHFDKIRGLFPENHLELQFAEIEKTIHLALKNGYKDICFLGDVSENPRLSMEAEVALLSFLCKWDRKINLHTILGNHDMHDLGNHSLLPFIEMQRNKLFKTIKFYTKPEVVNIDGTNFNFSPYPYTDSVKNAINLGHFEVSGSTGDNGRIIKKAHDVDKNAVWGMGHLHTPHDIRNVYYCGTLYQLNFGERLPKGSMLIEGRMSKGKLEHRVKRFNNDPAFKLINLIVESKSDLKKLEKNPLYKYRLISKSDIELPENLLEKFPNIVKTEGFSNKEELKALIEDSFVEIKHQTLQLPSLQTGILDFLKKNKGFDSKKLERAKSFLSEVRNDNKKRKNRVESSGDDGD